VPRHPGLGESQQRWWNAVCRLIKGGCCGWSGEIAGEPHLKQLHRVVSEVLGWAEIFGLFFL